MSYQCFLRVHLSYDTRLSSDSNCRLGGRPNFVSEESNYLVGNRLRFITPLQASPRGRYRKNLKILQVYIPFCQSPYPTKLYPGDEVAVVCRAFGKSCDVLATSGIYRVMRGVKPQIASVECVMQFVEAYYKPHSVGCALTYEVSTISVLDQTVDWATREE
ncbi:hypothetical protein Leryth_022805, partial [Lithospermum erythrorhizon]